MLISGNIASEIVCRRGSNGINVMLWPLVSSARTCLHVTFDSSLLSCIERSSETVRVGAVSAHFTKSIYRSREESVPSHLYFNEIAKVRVD